MKEYKPLNMFTSQTYELRKLILVYPDYPIIVLVNGEVCADDDSRWWYAPSLRFRLGELLDCEQTINDERVYTDRNDFEEDVRYALECDDNFEKWTDEEYEKAVKDKIAEYEPYWKNVICIYADV